MKYETILRAPNDGTTERFESDLLDRKLTKTDIIISIAFFAVPIIAVILILILI